jgi:protoporphyrinogen oxidase
MDNRKITIIGAGITGLTAGYLAALKGWDVTILERSAEAGGLLRTFPIGGARLECFYHHFFTHDMELLWLLDRLGLSREAKFHESTMGVRCDGRTYDFNTPRDLLRFSPLDWSGKFRFAASALYLGRFADWRKYEGISAMEWFSRYTGANVTRTIWAPMLRIKFGSWAEEVPAAWMVGRLRQRATSRKGGREYLGYLKGSSQILTDGLVESLNRMHAKVLTNVDIAEVIADRGTVKSIVTNTGEFREGIFLATIPMDHLANLLQKADPAYSASLRRVDYFGAACVILELTEPLSSVYWLNVADPGFPFGGVIEHTNLIRASEYQNSHIVYLSRYYETNDPLAAMNEGDLISYMTSALKRIYPNFSDAILKNAFVFRSNTAATVCDRYFSSKVPACASPLRNLFLANMAHVYPDERSINNSIRVAAEACRVMGIDDAGIPKGHSLSGLLGFEND